MSQAKLSKELEDEVLILLPEMVKVFVEFLRFFSFSEPLPLIVFGGVESG